MDDDGINYDDLPKKRHYCRKANRNFWLDWYEGRVEKYQSEFGDNFNLIFYQDAPPYDYYSIPFSLIRDNIPYSHIDSDRKRWVGTIENGILTVSRAPNEPAKLDVSNFYNRHQTGESPQVETPDETNDFDRRLPMGLKADGETLFTRSNSPEGWLYVLTNPKWPDWKKIGITRNLSKRRKSYNTGAPVKKVFYKYEYHRFHANAKGIERKIHYEDMKDNPKRGDSSEWYKLSLDEAKKIIDDNFD